MEKVRVLVVRAGNGVVEDIMINNTLKEYYRVLDCGSIEVIAGPIEGVVTVMDKEGKLKGKIPNFQISDGKGNIVDTIVGDVMFIDGSGEDFTSLSQEQVTQLEGLFE